ncbi:MAG: radical SAM protein [Patescibacteria group bacterium]
MKLRWSTFNIIEIVNDGYLIRNTMTGAVVLLGIAEYASIDDAILKGTLVVTSSIKLLIGENGILVNYDEDEVGNFFRIFHATRDNDVDTFTLHFLPTIACQLSCSYCFENGANRKGLMSGEIVEKSIKYLDDYFSNHKLRRMKVVLFGGEPLLGVKMIMRALPLFSILAQKHGLLFQTELVSNGEFLNEDVARFLHGYLWERLQITLDGPREVHDSIRFGSKGRRTFDTIINNILMVLRGKYIDKVDVRINYSLETKDRIDELLEYLACLEIQDNLNISFGIISPTLDESKEVFEQDSGNAYLQFCTKAKDLGFQIPVELTAGPWCVATEKHSIILQPDGSIQKCISTVGRSDFNFSNISVLSVDYAKDQRFEMFKRTDKCREEKCPYIPICGGGCPYDALVAHGEDGFGMRFCQKELLDTVNRGVVKT